MSGAGRGSITDDARRERDDESLMLAARGGDVSAFEVLARRYAGRLVTYCVQFTGNMAAAEEVAQETWLGLWSARASYEASTRFVVLLFVAARNRCRNVHRGKVRAISAFGKPDVVDVDALASSAPSGLERILLSERSRLVSSYVRRLSEPLREVLVLRVVDELAYADIGAVVGIPPATARSRVHLAVEQLRELARKDSHERR